MEPTDETCLVCAANGFYLARKSKNNEETFIKAMSNSLLVHPDEVKRILKNVKRKWTKKKTIKKKVKKK